MKRVNNLYKKICDLDVIMDMYDSVIRVNTKIKRKFKNLIIFIVAILLKLKKD